MKSSVPNDKIESLRWKWNLLYFSKIIDILSIFIGYEFGFTKYSSYIIYSFPIF